MYCGICGTKLNEDVRFCPECGAGVNASAEVQKENLPIAKTNLTNIVKRANSEGLRDYVDQRIRDTTVFLTAEDFIKNSKPMGFRNIIAGISTVILIFPFSFAAPLFGFAIWIILGLTVSTFLHYRLNKRKYLLEKPIDPNNLALYLRENLTHLPFDNWKVYNNDIFENHKISFVFNKKTEHDILIKTDNSFYKFENINVTGKTWLLSGGYTSNVLLYSNDYKTRPILEAAIEFYLEQV